MINWSIIPVFAFLGAWAGSRLLETNGSIPMIVGYLVGLVAGIALAATITNAWESRVARRALS